MAVVSDAGTDWAQKSWSVASGRWLQHVSGKAVSGYAVGATAKRENRVLVPSRRLAHDIVPVALARVVHEVSRTRSSFVRVHMDSTFYGDWSHKAFYAPPARLV